MKGLYFYKLVSPYQEDITKDCKLTVNEIDSNFMTLKETDISNFYTDYDNKVIVIETKGGALYKADISKFTTDVSVQYDKTNGSIVIKHDGVVDVMDGIITKENISSEILTSIMTDDTLVGNGTYKFPIGLSTVEKTSAYKSVIQVIDKTKNQRLPSSEKNALGDRYLSYEYYNEYGYLYTYPSALRFVQDMNTEWRIPTKKDWDNMLNAIEVCDEDRNHDIASCNNVLGKVAGKFLKSKDKWMNCGDCSCDCNHDCGCHGIDFDDSVCDCTHTHCQDTTCCCPSTKPLTPNGVDSYGMRILPSGYGDGGMMMDYFGRRAKFWTSTEIQVTNMYAKRFDYDKAGVVQVADNPRALASVRLVKDYDGNNFKSVETIGGVNYNCVLMPSLNTTHGYSIWLASNLAASQSRYCPVEPNNGDNLSNRLVYYINEWNGFDWVKKEFMEGDSVVIEFGPDDDRNAEYRLINGQLVNIKKDTIATVENKYDDAIDALNNKVCVIEGELSDINFSIIGINDKINEQDKELQSLNDSLLSEVSERQKVDTELWNAVTNEVAERQKVDTELWNAVTNEVSERQKVDTELWNAVNGEIAERQKVDTELWNAVTNEVAERQKIDTELWNAVNGEVAERQKVDTELWSAVNGEVSERQKVDTELWNAVNGEVSERQKVDTELWNAVNGEVSERQKVDTELWNAVTNEVAERQKVDTELWNAVNGEAAESDKRYEYITGRLITQSSSYSCENGVLILMTENADNKIIIPLNSNYGTF